MVVFLSSFLNKGGLNYHMDENTKLPIGDLSGRETTLGATSRQMVEQRAREIARFADRDPENFTDEDWDQAKAELLGGVASHTGNSIAENITSRADDGSLPSHAGNVIPKVEPFDEERYEERLANHGVDEATHDIMVEASLSDQKAEG